MMLCVEMMYESVSADCLVDRLSGLALTLTYLILPLMPLYFVQDSAAALLMMMMMMMMN